MSDRDKKGMFIKGHKLGKRFEKGQNPWNKGTKGVMKPNKTSFKKGHNIGHRFKKNHAPWNKGIHIQTNAGRTHFKKGQVPWNRGKHHSEETKEKLRQATIKQLSEGRMPNKETLPERLIENQLLFKGILYVKQHPYKYGVADFWLPEDNIIIECDGDYFHNPKYFPKTVKRDEKQIEWLEENDYIVYHFWEHEILKNPEECINKIVSRTGEILCLSF